MIQIFENINVFAKKECSIEETQPTKVKNFLMTLDLNQIGKISFTKNCSIKNFRTMCSHYICIKALRKTLKI